VHVGQIKEKQKKLPGCYASFDVAVVGRCGRRGGQAFPFGVPVKHRIVESVIWQKLGDLPLRDRHLDGSAQSALGLVGVVHVERFSELFKSA